MKLEVIPTRHLSNDEVKALKRLTLGPKLGYMFEDIEYWRTDPDTKVVRLSDDDGRVISWGLVYKYDERGNRDFQVYTRASERRKGYGKMVYDKAVQICNGRARLIVHPHTEQSVAYFNKLHYGPSRLPLMSYPIPPASYSQEED